MNLKKKEIVFQSILLSGALFLSGCAARKWDPAMEIGTITREEGSGTRSAFGEMFDLIEKTEDGRTLDHLTPYAVVTNSSAVMLSSIANETGSIGYGSMATLNDSVKAVSIDGIYPSPETIKNRSYPGYRAFYVVINPSQEKQNACAADFMSYVLSEEGQQVVEENEYVSLDDAASYSIRKQSGTVTVSGSSSVMPLMEKLAEAYEEIQPGIRIELQQSDSSSGIADVKDGISDIGLSSRDLKEDELNAGLEQIAIAYDGIVLMVNPQNPIDALTSEQVHQIFLREVTNWNELIETPAESNEEKRV